jgi:hypothetical protein
MFVCLFDYIYVLMLMPNKMSSNGPLWRTFKWAEKQHSVQQSKYYNQLRIKVRMSTFIFSAVEKNSNIIPRIKTIYKDMFLYGAVLELKLFT